MHFTLKTHACLAVSEDDIRPCMITKHKRKRQRRGDTRRKVAKREREAEERKWTPVTSHGCL